MRWYDIMSLGNEPACDVDTTPIFLKPANEVAERLCFYRCLSIILLGGSTCDHYPWCTGPHCTGLLLCTGPSSAPTQYRTLDPAPLLVTSGGQDWISVQTCALEDLTVQVPNQWWHLVAGFVRWASGLYASDWNAFLSTFCFDCLFSSRSLLLHFCPRRDVINKIKSVHLRHKC